MEYNGDTSSWISVGLFITVFLIWLVFYRICDHRIAGYVLLGIMLLQKCVTLFIFRIEPLDILIVVKTFSVIPFVLLMQYYRFDAPNSQCLSNFFAIVLAINIVEPGLLKEIPQGIYINAIGGFLVAALTILIGWNSSSVKSGQFVVGGSGWPYVLSYFVWHICLFYAQLYDVSAISECTNAALVRICGGEGTSPDWRNPQPDCQHRINSCRGDYFVFDTVLNAFPVVVSCLSEHGAGSWPQARAYSLAFKLAMNAFWTSTIAPKWWVRLFYIDISFDGVVFFWFQISVLVVVGFGFYFENQRRKQSSAQPKSSAQPDDAQPLVGDASGR
eukprot:TRINITY_DN57006_c0_g1_i1.p1 TRINITY_DN57006_c0_g1~~TRINITY_DN57006_c0_g1_i1.p1  ORF type:complete len:330 (+),score=28.62 TRINITY_DN57006_c0_g1_i1:53-1042(+)